MPNPEIPKPDPIHTMFTAYWNELSSFEAAAYERAKATTADLAKMASESFAYANQLAAEWRKLLMSFSPKA